jgi:hypothetical protein
MPTAKQYPDPTPIVKSLDFKILDAGGETSYNHGS